MKSLAEYVLENHKLYHSSGCNMAYWESRFDSLAARAKKELGISETDKLSAVETPDFGVKVRESSLDDECIAAMGDLPQSEYVELKSSNLF